MKHVANQFRRLILCGESALPFIVLILVLGSASAATSPVPVGAVMWKLQTASWDVTGPALSPDGGTVYIGCDEQDGTGLYALEAATGVTRWAAKGYSDPELAVGFDGSVYVANGSSLDALSGTNGLRRWSYSLSGAFDSLALDNASETVYAAGAGRVSALNSATGQLRWMSDERWWDHSPVLGPQGELYLQAMYTLYALNSATGQLLWSLESSEHWSSPIVGTSGTLYVPDKYQVSAVDGRTGTRGWKSSLEEGSAFSAYPTSPVLGADGILYVGCTYEYNFGGFNYGKVFALDPQDGRRKWMFGPTEWISGSPAVTADGTVYFGSGFSRDTGFPTERGRFYAIESRTGKERWYLDTMGSPGSPAIAQDGTVYFGVGRVDWVTASVWAVRGSAPPAPSAWPQWGANATRTARTQYPITPSFLEQSPSQVALEGEVVKLSVAVAGAPPPAIRWYHEGTLLPDATNTILQFAAIDRMREGTFWALATNAAGQTLSEPITLLVGNVNHNPRVRLLYQPGLGVEGRIFSSDSLSIPDQWKVLMSISATAATTVLYDPELPRAQRFYQAEHPGSVSVEGIFNAWTIMGDTGTQYVIEFVDEPLEGKRWGWLTNVTLPVGPFLFADDSVRATSGRHYRTTRVSSR